MIRTTISTAVAMAIVSTASAQTDVTGGQTNVLLDTDLLSSAASLDLSGVAGPVIAPGNLGAGSVAFGINTRDAMSLPTTFSYDASTFPGAGSFSGAIEHTGSVLFNNDTIEVGNFTIGFDGTRVGGDRSGFFVESTTGLTGVLFDIKVNGATPTPSSLEVAGDLLVSSEFAQILIDVELTTADLTGADVGDALVQAVPTPATAAVLGLAGLAARRRR
ncbi:MAG: hypothetical protein AAGG07_04165 [Planctomycetota bacterium]